MMSQPLSVNPLEFNMAQTIPKFHKTEKSEIKFSMNSAIVKGQLKTFQCFELIENKKS